MVGLERNPLLWAPSRKPNDKFQLLPIRPTKSSTWRKASGISQQKNASPIQVMQVRTFLWLPGKNCYSLPRKVWFIPCIHQTLHLWISIYFSLYKILLVEKISIPWKTVKGTWDSSLLKKIKNFGEDEIMKLPGKWQKVVEQHSNILFNKVLGEKEKCVFHFYFKTEGTFWPTQYFQNFFIIPNRNMYALSYRSPFPLPPIIGNLYSFFL